MKIAFDSQIFSLQQYGGISRYYCELATALAAIEGIEPRIIAPMNRNSYLESIPPKIKRGYQQFFWSRLERSQRFASKLYEELSLTLFKPDIIHETYYSATPVGSAQSIRVLTIYDMIHERFPEIFSRSDVTASNKAAAAARADHIICISEVTRHDVMELLGIPETKVSVVHLAAGAMQIGADATSHKSPETSSYILYVGARQDYKNFRCLLEAYVNDKFRREYKIVCFGGGSFSRAEKQLFADYGLTPESLDHVAGDDALLATYYRFARCLVYPSLYEGFGIPPLEAMTMGCPVVCSNRSSIPEVVGDAGAYFDPTDSSSLTTAIHSVIANSQRREELIHRGHLRQAEFSWARCARETSAVYRSLLT